MIFIIINVHSDSVGETEMMDDTINEPVLNNDISLPPSMVIPPVEHSIVDPSIVPQDTAQTDSSMDAM